MAGSRCVDDETDQVSRPVADLGEANGEARRVLALAEDRPSRARRIRLLRDDLVPKSNQFSYGQVESPYGSGQFIKDIRGTFEGDETVLTSEIPNKEAIYKSIQDFLGKGK